MLFLMNINDEDIDLGLSLGSRNHPIQTRLNVSSGAGVNANLSLDMAFAASDPLSELVWSPHNGLSLKSTDSSSAEKKPFLLWNVGPKGKGLSTSVTVRSKGSGDGKVDDNLTVSQTVLNTDAAFCDKSTLVASSRSSRNPEIGASNVREIGGISEEAAGPSESRKEENRENGVEENFLSSWNIQLADAAESSQKNAGEDILANVKDNCEDDTAMNETTCHELIVGTGCYQNTANEIDAESSDIKGSAVAEPHKTRVSEAPFCSQSSRQQQEPYHEATSETGSMTLIKARMPIPATPLMKLESSAENERFPNAKEAYALGDTRIAKENSLPFEISPTNSRMRIYREKGKGKAVSDGGINPRLLDDGDDSHDESMESCNSARSFSSGIKRKNFNHELMVESKRSKKEGSHGLTSLVGPDSSFMNWIKNMVKGLSDSYRDESSSRPLTIHCPSDIHDKTLHEISTLDKDSSSQNTGFHSVFKSLYQSKKLPDTGMIKGNHSVEESKAIVVADNTKIGNSCERDDDDSCKQLIVSNKEVKPHTSENAAVQRYKPWIFSADYLKSSFLENKSLEKPNHDEEKVSPSDHLCKNVNSMASRPEKGNPSMSLWITRLYTRTPKLENGSRGSQERNEPEMKCPENNLETNDVFSVGHRSSEARNVENQLYSSKKEVFEFSVEAETSFDFNATSKLNPILPSLKQKRSSEEMTSVFARRLDALRNILPSERVNSSTCALACFFCGGSNHDLRECPEVTETELEDLLVKISSLDRVKESRSICIRCFQLDHWAVSCPFASVSSSQQSDRNAISLLKLSSGKQKGLNYLSREEDHKLVAASQMAGSSKEPCSSSFPCFMSWDAKASSSKKLATAVGIQTSSASNSENNLIDRRNFPSFNFITPKNTGEIFLAIRKLRLTRADIVRWMDSDVPLSHLNGFFLRLRLGNSEGGLGGTGYYAACITGETIEHIGCKSILVDVGGIKFRVGSRYISNHHFLEEEIQAWWSRIVQNGGKIPSLDELNSKLNDRISLGF